MLKIFRGWHWTIKIILMNISIPHINLWNEFFFFKPSDDTVQAYTSKPVLIQLLSTSIKVQITVHDRLVAAQTCLILPGRLCTSVNTLWSINDHACPDNLYVPHTA